MRHLNIDWHRLVGGLETWTALEYRSQNAYLKLKPNQYTARKDFDEEDCQTLIAKRLLAASADGTKVRVPPEAREFSGAMRAMHRHRFHASSTEAALKAYISDHLTVEERHVLLPDTGYHSYNRSEENAHLVARKDWLQQVLDLPDTKSANAWEYDRLPEPGYRSKGIQFEDGSPYFEDEALFDALKRLLATAVTWAEPVPLAELAERVTDVEPDLLHRAIMPAVRYLLLFPWLEGDESAPVIGIWPQIAYLLHRPAPRAPEPVEPAETFHAPVLIEDMTSVLVAAAAEPLRVLASGGGLYAKDVQRLAESAFVLPDWLTPEAETHHLGPLSDRAPSPVESRMLDAVQTCIEQELLQSHLDERERDQLQITAAGRDWLGKDVRERLRLMLEPWRESPQPKKQNNARRRSTLHAMVDEMEIAWSGNEEFSPWTPSRLRWGVGSGVKHVDWRAAFVDLLGDAESAFVPVGQLLAYHSRVNNPLLGRRRQGSYGPTPRLDSYGYGRRDPNELHFERMWNALANDMIVRYLVPLGAVQLGWLGETLAIRLHDIGRYMLGLADDFDYRAAPEGSVIIQPNFEVSFLGPAPRAEAIVGRLAERTGSRTGTMFRITRASVLAAAAAGITADDALRDLADVSSKPLPANVQREVRGWFDTTRHVRMKQAWLIEAPDEATATRILAAAGKQARQLTPTLVEITAGKKQHSALVRTLKAAGVFVR